MAVSRYDKHKFSLSGTPSADALHDMAPSMDRFCIRRSYSMLTEGADGRLNASSQIAMQQNNMQA